MKNTGKESEKTFEEMMGNGSKLVYIHRLSDTNQIKGLSSEDKKLFVQAQPADYIVTLKGKMFYAEVKSCSNKTSFPFGNFTKSQWVAMKKQVTAGGLYNVFIHNLNTDTWYCVPAMIFLARDEQGVRSLKWVDMKEFIW